MVQVMRVEDSKMWLRYMDSKHQLTLEAQESRFQTPNELDGMPRSGDALTSSILQEFHGDEAISVAPQLSFSGECWIFRYCTQTNFSKNWG